MARKHIQKLRLHIGMQVRLARVAARLTQTELARCLGRGQNYMHKIETGKSDCTILDAVLISQALQIDVVDLLRTMTNANSDN